METAFAVAEFYDMAQYTYQHIRIVVLSAVLVKCGYAAGIVSGLITFLYTAFFFSTRCV